MNTCKKCKKIIRNEETYKHHSEILCEDCYTDILLPPVRKMYYEKIGSGFMTRLKDSYIACPQQFH